MNTEDVKNLIGKSITWKLGNNPRDEYYGVVLASSQDRKWPFVKMPPQNYRGPDQVSMIRVDDMVDITEV